MSNTQDCAVHSIPQGVAPLDAFELPNNLEAFIQAGEDDAADPEDSRFRMAVCVRLLRIAVRSLAHEWA